MKNRYDNKRKCVHSTDVKNEKKNKIIFAHHLFSWKKIKTEENMRIFSKNSWILCQSLNVCFSFFLSSFCVCFSHAAQIAVFHRTRFSFEYRQFSDESRDRYVIYIECYVLRLTIWIPNDSFFV